MTNGPLQERDNRARRRWMGVLARSPGAALAAAWRETKPKPEHAWVRRPEIGMAMIRARIGGSGAPFNLGETTVTRCALAIGDIVGIACVQGRDKAHAEHAALFDALMQDEERRGEVERRVIGPLERALCEREAERRRLAAATRVDFFTMARERAP